MNRIEHYTHKDTVGFPSCLYAARTTMRIPNLRHAAAVKSSTTLAPCFFIILVQIVQSTFDSKWIKFDHALTVAAFPGGAGSQTIPPPLHDTVGSAARSRTSQTRYKLSYRRQGRVQIQPGFAKSRGPTRVSLRGGLCLRHHGMTIS